jgi:hypothetical protein
MAEYPMMSPYVAFNNNPIYFVDPLGLEGECPGEPEKEVEGIEGKDNITWNPGISNSGHDNKNLSISIGGKKVEAIDNSVFGDDPDWVMDRFTVIGNYAHSRFDRYIIEQKDRTRKNWVANKKFEFSNKRPDLVYIGSGSNIASIWELKPNPDSNKGRTLKQVMGYVSLANKDKEYGKTKWSAGNSNGTPAPFVKPLILTTKDGKYTFTYSIPDPSTGMIYYTY